MIWIRRRRRVYIDHHFSQFSRRLTISMRCGKCAKNNVCPCRVKIIKCSDFCRCKGVCRNPVNYKITMWPMYFWSWNRQYLKIMNYFSVHVLNVEIFNNLDNRVSCFWICLFTTTCLFVYQWSIYSVDNFKIWQKFPKIWPKSDPYFTKISDQNLTKFWEISDLILNHCLISLSTGVKAKDTWQMTYWGGRLDRETDRHHIIILSNK